MQSLGLTMTRDCDTTRMKQVELVGLLDTMTPLDQQMITARMPAIRVTDLQAVPESVELAEGTPQTIIDVQDEVTRRTVVPSNVRFRKPVEKMRAIALPRSVVAAPAGGDVTLIGVICSLSLSLCAALAWLG